MAKEPRSNNSADDLKAEVDRSRERLARDFRGLRYELDFPRKIRRSFERQTVAWLAGAVVVGTLIVLLPLRKKKVYVEEVSGAKLKSKGKLLEAGFVLGALRLAITLFRPAITSFITKKLGSYAAQTRPGRSRDVI